MLTKLSALYHYLLKNNHLDEALDILKLASFNQGENTRIRFIPYSAKINGKIIRQ